jgi:DNA-binding LytR/AlgR family response regulator
MIRTLIIEDENPAAVRLEALLKRIDPEIIILEKPDTVESAVSWLKKNPQPDLIFLDIQLGDGLSFDIFGRVKVESYVIFTTAFDEYAIRAFELNSIDYLLKPVSEENLVRSIEKFRKLSRQERKIDLEQLIETIEKRESRFKKRFVISVAGKIRVIETGNIAFFWSKEKNTFLTSTDKKSYPIDFSLDQLESMIDPEIFFRVNRQFIVQYKSIDKIDVLSKSRIRITTSPPADDEILVSSARTPEFRSWLDR